MHLEKEQRGTLSIVSNKYTSAIQNMLHSPCEEWKADGEEEVDPGSGFNQRTSGNKHTKTALARMDASMVARKRSAIWHVLQW